MDQQIVVRSEKKGIKLFLVKQEKSKQWALAGNFAQCYEKNSYSLLRSFLSNPENQNAFQILK
jgi:hypothetical protein